MKIKIAILIASLLTSPAIPAGEKEMLQSMEQLISQTIHITAQRAYLAGLRKENYSITEERISKEWGPFTGSIHLVKKVKGEYYESGK